MGITNRTLADSSDDGECSRQTDNSGTSGGGEMARRNVTATFTPASGATSGTVVELNTDIPFTFDSTNATAVIDSGLFNADYEGAAAADNDQCSPEETQSVRTDWNMFSRQLLNGVDGIDVTSGDSLSVKWTITVG